MLCPAPLLWAADAAGIHPDAAQLGPLLCQLQHLHQLSTAVVVSAASISSPRCALACYGCGYWWGAASHGACCPFCGAQPRLVLPTVSPPDSTSPGFRQLMAALSPQFSALSHCPVILVLDVLGVLISWVSYLVKHLRHWDALSLPSIPLLAGDHVLCMWRTGDRG